MYSIFPKGPILWHLVFLLLLRFYQSVIESIIGFGITVWFGGTASSEKNKLERIVRRAFLLGPTGWGHCDQQ